MKRWIVLLILLLPAIAACGNVTGSATATPTDTSTLAPDGDLIVDRAQLADELNLYNWTQYIDPAVLEQFEAEYGVHVNVDLYESNEELLAGLRGAPAHYDIAVPADELLKPMIAENLLAPLDKNLLPNLQYLNPDLLNQHFDPGNRYSVPYFWGTTGLAYNQNYFAQPPDSWAVIFERESLEQLKYRFAMLDNYPEQFEAALLYQGASINQFTDAELARAEHLLRAQQPYLKDYASTEVANMLISEEIILAQIWSGAAGQFMYGVDDLPGNPNIRYLIPQEGGTIWQDNLVILADAPHHYTAHVFINYLMRPDIAARNADWVLYFTPNLAAYPILAEETLHLYNLLLPDSATMDRLEWTDRSPEAEQRLHEAIVRLQRTP